MTNTNLKELAMGQDVSAAHAKKMQMLNLEGRACKGPSRSRLGCATRAVVEQGIESWTYEIGVGPVTDRWAPMCRRHANQTPVGFTGVNFRVSGEREFIEP
jgi:hypothetical protein